MYVSYFNAAIDLLVIENHHTPTPLALADCQTDDYDAGEWDVNPPVGEVRVTFAGEVLLRYNETQIFSATIVHGLTQQWFIEGVRHACEFMRNLK